MDHVQELRAGLVSHCLIGRTELDSNCRASIPACRCDPYSGKRERLPYKMNAKSIYVL